jgi:hypothetical protein
MKLKVWNWINVYGVQKLAKSVKTYYSTLRHDESHLRCWKPLCESHHVARCQPPTFHTHSDQHDGASFVGYSCLKSRNKVESKKKFGKEENVDKIMKRFHKPCDNLFFRFCEFDARRTFLVSFKHEEGLVYLVAIKLLTEFKEMIWTCDGVNLSAVPVDKFVGYILQKCKCCFAREVTIANCQRTNRTFYHVTEIKNIK